MNLGQTDEVIAQIYEAALIPEYWPGLLQKLVDSCEGASASVFSPSGSDIKFVGTPEAQRLIADYVSLGRPDLNSRIPARLRIREHGFFSDFDFFPIEQIRQDPFYQEFLYPRGGGWVAANCIRPPTGELISVNIERAYSRGPFEPETIEFLNRLDPHLARAGLLAIRLGLQLAHAAADVLQMLGLPGAVLRQGGRLMAANALFERLMPSLAQDRGERLRLTEPGADALFAAALEQLSSRGRHEGVRSVPVAAREELPPIILHLLPVQGAAHDIFSRSAALLVVTPVDRAAVPTAEVLQGLFDLTPAEARVARGIGEAQTIDTLAEALGVSRETVRTQLKAVLAKTGLTRQQELISLLVGKTIPRASER